MKCIGNIGLDRVRFVLEGVMIDSNVYKMGIEKGDKAEVYDIATDENIKISDFNLTLKGIALSDKDDYTIKIELIKKPIVCFVLDVNIPKLLYNSNENNASNIQHLKEVNHIIEKKLEEIGIFTDMNMARISNIEVNVNSSDKKLYDAMKVIKKGWNSTNDKVFITESHDKIESLMIKNSYLKIKVYNKIKQLKDTSQLHVNKNLVRIEVSTNHKKVLNRISNDDMTLDSVINNFDKVEKWFNETIKKQVKKPIEDFQNKVINKMIEELKQGHKTYDVLLNHAIQGNLVDLESFDKAMKKYYKETNKKKPHTIIKNTKARLNKINEEVYCEITGNMEALNNLWNEMEI